MKTQTWIFAQEENTHFKWKTELADIPWFFHHEVLLPQEAFLDHPFVTQELGPWVRKKKSIKNKNKKVKIWFFFSYTMKSHKPQTNTCFINMVAPFIYFLRSSVWLILGWSNYHDLPHGGGKHSSKSFQQIADISHSRNLTNMVLCLLLRTICSRQITMCRHQGPINQKKSILYSEC